MRIARLLRNIIAGTLIAVPAFVQAQTFERGLALELFTGQECPSCPRATSALAEVVAGNEDNDRLVWVTHHAGYYPDSLTLKESVDLAAFLGISSAPHLLYNRSMFYFDPKSPELLLDAVSFANYNNLYAQYMGQGKTYIQTQLEERADISVDIDLTYDKAARALTARVYGQRGEGLEAASPAVSVWLMQDIYVGFQLVGASEYNPTYRHHNPVRMSLSADYLGDRIEFDEDGKWELNYECVIPEELEPYDHYGHIVGARVPVDDTDMHVAAIVYNRDETTPSGPDGRETIGVLNAVKCKLGNCTTSSSVPSDVVADDVRAYAVDGRIVVEGSYDTFAVYTLAGQMVGGDALPRGVYLVRIMSDGVGRTVKVLVG